MRAKDFRAQAWSALNGKWGKVAVVALVYMVATAVVGAIPGVGTVASLLISGPLTVSFAAIALKVLKNEEFEVANLADGFQNFTNTFLLGFLNSLFIALWSLLFFIPGIIKGISYSMSYYILAENPEMSHSDARRASMEMMEGHKWEYFCLQLSFIGWLILVSITFGILSFWVTPYMQTASAAFYENLKANQNASF